MMVLLSMCLTKFLSHGISPAMINTSLLVPIPKNRRASLSSSKNYRAIALNTLINKIIDNIFIDYLKVELKSSDYQFAYKENFSTTLCSFLVMETIQYYNSKGSSVLSLFLDASKAFDKVEHSILFKELVDRNICPVIIRYLRISYLCSKVAVKWNSQSSEFFSLGNGVKQGAVLSPILFSVYINPLLEEINSSGIGCHIGQTCTNIFGYADDLLLLAPTRSAMVKLIDICEKFSEKFNLTFNPDKCVLIIFPSPNCVYGEVSLQMFGKVIPVKYSEKHLGHWMSSSGSRINFSDAIRDLRVRTNAIMADFTFLDARARVQIFNTHCLALYGCELWDLECVDFQQLCCEWRKCSRRILKIHARSHNNLIPGLMLTPSIEVMVHCRIINFCCKGLNHPAQNVNFLFRQSLINASSVFARNVSRLCRNYSLGLCDIKNNSHYISRHLKRMSSESGPAWKIGVIHDLLCMRDGMYVANLSYQEILFTLEELCIN